MAALVPIRVGSLLLAGTLVGAAACGSGSDTFNDVDSGLSDASVDRPIDPEAGPDAPTESGGDSRTSDALSGDEDAHSIDASADVANPDAAMDAGDTRDAIDESDAATDAPGDVCSVTGVYVDAIHGADTSDGSAMAPYKTITKAISAASRDACILTIRVSPGTYDVANGEAFPLAVPPRVSLLGDETDKGAAGSGATLIHGSGLAFDPVLATIYPGSGATIAGFEITAPPSDSDAAVLFPMEILLYGSAANVTVRNNTLTGSSTDLFFGSIGVYVAQSLGNVIIGNVVTGNAIGLYNGLGGSSKIESNVVTQNTYGFEGDDPGADLGGGAFASAGLNTLACNQQNMWLAANGPPSANDYWDHLPPTKTGTLARADIYLSPFFTPAPPMTTGAMLATPNCP